jgi:hypothetical protein
VRRKRLNKLNRHNMVDPEVLARLHRAREPKAKKEPKPIARKVPLEKIGKIKPRSKKQNVVMRTLETLYRSFLAGYDECEIKSPNCTGQVETVHHTKGRGINVVFLQKYWKRSCNACNFYIENKDQWAKDNGHKVSRHNNEE